MMMFVLFTSFERDGSMEMECQDNTTTCLETHSNNNIQRAELTIYTYSLTADVLITALPFISLRYPKSVH